MGLWSNVILVMDMQVLTTHMDETRQPHHNMHPFNKCTSTSINSQDRIVIWIGREAAYMLWSASAASSDGQALGA